MDKKEAMKQFAALGQSWYGNSKQHAAFAAYDRYNGYNKLADKFQEEADEEWKEAMEVTNRLVELGYNPAELAEASKPIEYPLSDDPKEQLEIDFKCGTSNEAIRVMSELIHAFDDDYITQALIQKWTADEKSHIDWNRQHRQLIEKVGYDNYLLEML